MNRDPTRPELTNAERLLLGYLHRHCRTVGRARTYARLRADLERETGLVVREREMYDLVSNLVLKRRPVATTPTGAYIFQTPKDVRMGLRNLVGRVIRQARRIRAYKATAREGLTRQQYLDLADAEQAYETARRPRPSDDAMGNAAPGQGLLFGSLAPGQRACRQAGRT